MTTTDENACRVLALARAERAGDVAGVDALLESVLPPLSVTRDAHEDPIGAEVDAPRVAAELDARDEVRNLILTAVGLVSALLDEYTPNGDDALARMHASALNPQRSV